MVPAAAVIPSPRVYSKLVSVKIFYTALQKEKLWSNSHLIRLNKSETFYLK